MYDKNNIFAKILRNELPAKKLYEDEKILAFYDKFPVAPIHVLVIPKGEYIDYYDFIRNASSEEISNYFLTIPHIIDLLKINDSSFRLIMNTGENSGQSVFHFHTHIISGRKFLNLIG